MKKTSRKEKLACAHNTSAVNKNRCVRAGLLFVEAITVNYAAQIYGIT